jgi:hypothetical protein
MVLVRACSFTGSSSARSGLSWARLASQRYEIVTAQTGGRSPHQLVGTSVESSTQYPRCINPSERVGPRWDCLGYAAFVKALDNKDTARWFTTLLQDLDRLADNLDEHRARLVALQHALLRLIDLLDPHGERVSAGLRQPL